MASAIRALAAFAAIEVIVTAVAPAQALPDSAPARDAHAPMWTSLVATVIPAGVGAVLSSNGGQGGIAVVSGLWLGPAVGYWTHGVASKSVPGLLIRTGGFLLAGIGAFAEVISTPVDAGYCCGSTPKSSWVPPAMIITGTAIVVGSAVYDIATVDRKVRAHQRALSSIDVTPMFAANGRRGGVAVRIRF